ncbi:uncharacterized protein ARMOST_17241 [Armillaria ostoyae]|uniref:Uncharacterized protein n=1 Tax=Armillaria ostoyae TaxID=47428 RepID=A0A284RYF9_ARMOS|nr:uncharacterized protein ARMOST_17241 [Armillaria ostoyae]
MLPPPDLTPSKIHSDPTILLHSRAVNIRASNQYYLFYILKGLNVYPPAVGPFDGKWGAVFDDIDYFIITPNATMICMPPLGANREVYMRADYRYGHDDPLHWPQAYVEQFPHLACIRYIKPEPSDAFYPLYHRLTEYDFVECDSQAIVKGVGHLRRSTFLKLEKACQIIIESMSTVDATESVVRNMRGHMGMLELLTGRLHALPTSFSRVCLTFAETQHVVLELRALVEYMTIFKPRMDASGWDAPSFPVDKDLLGAFSNDATIVQRFFKAGIPVWRMVPMKDLAGTRVDALYPFVTSPITEEPCCLRLPSVFVGSSRDPTKYVKIQEFVTHSLRWVDPFAISSPIILSRSDVPLAVASSSSSRYSPYRKNAQPKSSNSNCLIDPQHPLLPPLVEPWCTALLSVDANTARCHACARPSPSNPTAIPRENQYAFPRPDIIATVKTDEKANSFLVSWLRLRIPLYARLTVTERVPANLYHQEWRTVLELGFLHTAGESGGQTTKRHKEVRKMMDGYLDDFPLYADNKVSTAFWKGKAYQSLTTEERQEICWELGKVNFRCEFRALHHRAASSSGPSISAFDLSRCFADGQHLPGQLDVGSANYGIAHHLWLERAPCIFAMKKVMRTWRGHPASLETVKPAGWTEEEFLDLEKQIASFYTDTFFLYFGRAPVLPRQLSHKTLDEYVPERRHRVTTTRSGIYLDAEELL